MRFFWDAAKELSSWSGVADGTNCIRLSRATWAYSEAELASIYPLSCAHPNPGRSEGSLPELRTGLNGYSCCTSRSTRRTNQRAEQLQALQFGAPRKLLPARNRRNSLHKLQHDPFGATSFVGHQRLLSCVPGQQFGGGDHVRSDGTHHLCHRHDLRTCLDFRLDGNRIRHQTSQ